MPNGLAGDSPPRISCSGSYCEGYGLDGKNLSSWSHPEPSSAGIVLDFGCIGIGFQETRQMGGRRPVSKEVRALIFRMAAENPTWGAPRIHGELLMLGFDLSEPTVSRWVRRAPRILGPGVLVLMERLIASAVLTYYLSD